MYSLLFPCYFSLFLSLTNFFCDIFFIFKFIYLFIVEPCFIFHKLICKMIFYILSINSFLFNFAKDSTYLICESLVQDKISQLESEAFQTPNLLGCCCCCYVASVMCDPIDGSPPGSPVPGILQARTLEWVAISFSNAWKWKVKVKSLSRVWPSMTPWTAAYQAPLSMGFSRQEYWRGVPVPSILK